RGRFFFGQVNGHDAQIRRLTYPCESRRKRMAGARSGANRRSSAACLRWCPADAMLAVAPENALNASAGAAPEIGGIVVPGFRVALCRECGGYNTREGKKPARLMPRFQAPGARADRGHGLRADLLGA